MKSDKIKEAFKEKIKLFMNVQEYFSDKRLPTDASWDNYFIENYSSNVIIESDEEEFITYSIQEGFILIKDFIAHGNGLKLISKIIKKGNQLKLPILAYVHFTNNQVLNIAIKRYKFRILNVVGKQYLIGRK